MNYKRRYRLLGIDLFRGIAVFCVIVLHSDGIITTKPPTWEVIRQFSGFAVPFFLSTSFYLAINKLYSFKENFNLIKRLKRLIIPYFSWSFIYIFYQFSKYLIEQESDKINSLLNHYVSTLFLGGAALHLYFLPLLITGTLVIKLCHYLILRQINLRYLLIGVLLSLIFYQEILISGNSFQVGYNVAFQPLLDSIFLQRNNPLMNLISVWLSWILRCIPYIIIAMVLSHPITKNKLRKFNFQRLNYVLFISFMFLITNLFAENILPESIYEISRGYLALLVAILISRYLKNNYILNSLGVCSFGIYLIHLLVIDFGQIIILKIYPEYGIQTSSLMLLTFSIFSFIVSWVAIYFLVKQKTIAPIMFGN